MPKEEKEFFDPSTLIWHKPEGYPEGVLELIVAEDKKTKEFTRLTILNVLYKKHKLNVT
ncbi:hypothetical protein LGK95_19150 [Clostridium algoriphilum]|uniref:hypothetical protein n=1 Tax=Clostridium algoriphilum TaxID=198347 RepID=UPI001CF1AE35|nr:hypothetical protein [Clostridium algoriphilum]MCB2295600.1 hypothetical protein [Clostridium algoriphilum]